MGRKRLSQSSSGVLQLVQFNSGCASGASFEPEVSEPHTPPHSPRLLPAHHHCRRLPISTYHSTYRASLASSAAPLRHIVDFLAPKCLEKPSRSSPTALVDFVYLYLKSRHSSSLQVHRPYLSPVLLNTSRVFTSGIVQSFIDDFRRFRRSCPIKRAIKTPAITLSDVLLARNCMAY